MGNIRDTDPIFVIMTKRRNQLGLSQQDLAKMCGIGQSSISELETGRISPTLKTLRKVLENLKMEIVLTELIPSSIERDILYLKSLGLVQLERELLSRRWYVRPDDLVGGYCVMPVDAPPSCGCPSIADFASKSQAEHIVELHNSDLMDSGTELSDGVGLGGR